MSSKTDSGSSHTLHSISGREVVGKANEDSEVESSFRTGTGMVEAGESFDPPSEALTTIPTSTHPALPTEILGLIVAHLARPELVQCLRVCTVLHDLAASRLYAAVALDIRTGWSQDGPAQPLGMQFIRATKLLPSPDRVARFTIPAYLTLTTSLALKAHSDLYCRSLQSLDMPNLVVLRILPSEDSTREECGGRARELQFGGPSGFLMTSQGPCCPLLLRLRPRRVILGTPETVLEGEVRGLWTTAANSWSVPKSPPTPFPPSFVKEITVILGRGYGADCYISTETGAGDRGFSRWKNRLRLDLLPNTVTRLVLIMGGSEAPKRPPRRVVPTPDRREIEPSCFPWPLAQALLGSASGVEVVGMESQGHPRPGADVMLAGLKAYLLKQGMAEEEAERKSQAVVFTTGKEYVKGCEDCQSGLLGVRYD